MTIWKTIFYILAIIPMIFIVSIMTFYFKAGQILGRAPYYNNPDPKDLDIYKLYSPYIDWTVEIWLYALPGWLVLAMIYFLKMRNKVEWTPIVLSSSVQVFGFLLLFSEIFEWYID